MDENLQDHDLFEVLFSQQACYIGHQGFWRTGWHAYSHQVADISCRGWAHLLPVTGVSEYLLTPANLGLEHGLHYHGWVVVFRQPGQELIHSTHAPLISNLFDQIGVAFTAGDHF